MSPRLSHPGRAATLLLAIGALSLGGCQQVREMFFSGEADGPAGTDAPAHDTAGAGDTAGAEGAATRPEQPVTVEERIRPQAVTRSIAATTYSLADQERFNTSPVPVLGPGDATSPQGRAFATNFRATAEGYFSTMPVSGGRAALSASQRFARVPGTPTDRGEYAPRLEASTIGLSIAFGRFGTDYLVEIECEDADAACMDDAQARRLVSQLVVLGGGSP